MRSFPFKGFLSGSNWEESYFGGYYKVLSEYPFIDVSSKIKFDFDKDSLGKGLSFYNRTKLCKMFLLAIKDEKLISSFILNAKYEEKPWEYNPSIIVKRTTIDPAAIGEIIGYIVSRGHELSNMFNNYQESLEGTTFYMEEFLNKEKQDNSSPDKKSDKKDSDKKEKQENKENQEDQEKSSPGKESQEFDEQLAEVIKAGKKAHKKLYELLEKVSKHESQYETYSSYKTLTTGAVKKTDVREKVVPAYDDYYEPIGYSATELSQAEHLVKMLDISFDSDKDTVRNLKSGKMDAHKLAQVAAGNTYIYSMVQEDQKTRPFKVCILMDESGSMTNGSLLLNQAKTCKILFDAFSQIMPQEHIFVYGHSGTNKPELRVYNDKLNPNFDRTYSATLSNSHEQNYDGPIIEYIQEKLRKETSDNILMICLSDGEPEGYDYGGKSAIKELKQIIERGRRDGFVTVGIGINSSHVSKIFKYNTYVEDLGNLAKQASGIINVAVKAEFQN